MVPLVHFLFEFLLQVVLVDSIHKFAQRNGQILLKLKLIMVHSGHQIEVL